MEKTTKRGRPALREEDRRNRNFTFRSRGQLHEQLQASAKVNERSVSEEIERRLERSFRDQELLSELLEFTYGRELAGLLVIVGEAMKDTGRLAGFMATGSPDISQNWWDNPYAFDQATHAATRILRAMAPPGKPQPPAKLPFKVDGLPAFLGGANRFGSDIATGILREIASDKPTSTTAIERAPRVRKALGSWAGRIKEFLGRQS